MKQFEGLFNSALLSEYQQVLPDQITSHEHQRFCQHLSHVNETDLSRLMFDLAQYVVELKGKLSTIYLTGDLGAGKTTAVRAFLRALGVSGPIKSPTYALVEPYSIDVDQQDSDKTITEKPKIQLRVSHWDLYRLADPEELEYVGFRDYLAPGCVQLIEWPERGTGYLYWPDVLISLRLPTVPVSQGAPSMRCVECYGFSDVGKSWLKRGLLA